MLRCPAITLALICITSACFAQTPMKLVLPTDNDALYRGDAPAFYMFVDRTFDNQVTTPWEGGSFGYVRGPVKFGDRVVMRTFHEGLDIAPLRRDAAGEPLDEVRSLSDGEVVHVSDSPGASNYGRYIVVRHDWGDGPFYSLYAHLSKTLVKVGAKVQPGSPLGIMGHTGTGLDKRRSHVHVELNLFLSHRFPEWHEKNFRPSPNHHGLYNGLNLSGLNLAALLLAHQKNPALRVSEFIQSQEPAWRVIVPRKGSLEILKNYPWLGKEVEKASSSWVITLNDSGLPLEVKANALFVDKPELAWVRNTGMPHSYHTRGYINGSGETGTLTASGFRFLELLTGDFTAPPPQEPVAPVIKKKE
jgi:murein DD-endopeptidase MepM/ murein hydrolase activator NlpD